MKYLQLMKKYPFPKNGRELNKTIITKIQDPNIKDKKEYVTQLFKNNIGIVSKVFSENNYDKINATIEEFLSFYYESLLIAIENYNINKGMAFHNYLYLKLKSSISNDYKYTGSLIHVPEKKIANEKYETINLSSLMEETFLGFSNTEDEHRFDIILDDPFFIKRAKELLSEDEYQFFSLWRNYSMVEVGKIMQLSKGKLHRIPERIKNKLTSIIDLSNLNNI